MELAPTSPQTQETHPAAKEILCLDSIEAVKMECKEMGIEKQLEEEQEEDGEPSEPLTSSRMVNMSAIESSQMFVSLLAEGSSIRYDSSMQVCDGKWISITTFGMMSLI